MVTMVDAQRLIAASQENNVLRPRRGRQPRWTASVSSVSSSGGVPPVARPAPKGEKTLAEVSRELDIQPHGDPAVEADWHKQRVGIRLSPREMVTIRQWRLTT